MFSLRVVRDMFTGREKSRNVAAVILLIGAIIALFASLVLSIEAIEIAKAPDVVLNCDLNSVISCGGVARHWSAELAGFPNSFIGLGTLPVMITIAVALLARTRFPRWFMIGAQIGVCFGLIFVIWMLYTSLFDIQMICPWCLATDLGMLLIFYGLTRYNVLTGVISSDVMTKTVQKGYDALVLSSLIALVIVIIIVKFGEQLF